VTRRRIRRARIRYNKARRWCNRLYELGAAHYAADPDMVTRCWRPRRLTRKRALAAIGAPHLMALA
jgi:hypothetical protein